MSNESDPYRGAFQQAPAAVPPRPPVRPFPSPARGPDPVEHRGAEDDFAAEVATPRWGEEPAVPVDDYPAAQDAFAADETPVHNGTAQPSYAEEEVYRHEHTPQYRAETPPRPAPAPVVYDRPVPAVREAYLPATEVALDHLETRRKQVPAKQGWRGALHKLTRINIAPGKDEQYELGLQERVLRIVRTTFPIAVMGVKGGVGKTVVTEALGSTFSAVRGGRVVAVDVDPDAGNLISRHGRESALSIADLVADSSLRRYLDVRAHTSRDKTTGLEVLTGPDFARTDLPLLRDDLEKVMPILKEHYSLALLDTGTGLKTNLMRSVLGQARALVVVSSASIDALEETQVTLEWLRHNGYQKLLDTTVLLINHTQRGKANIDVGKAVEQFSRQIRPERIFVLPFDAHINEGKEIVLELLSSRSRRRYLEIAAAISDLFPKTAAAE